MTSLLFRVIDLETTGFPPDAGVCEIGWTDITLQGAPWNKASEEPYSINITSYMSELCDPGRKIEVAAKAVHHIWDEDLIGARPAEAVFAELLCGVDYFVAHNAKFEQEFFNPPVPWICTLKAAYRLCPKAPNHQNQTIRYFLNTPVPREEAIHTHRAGPDSLVTAYTLAKFLTAASPETMAAWTLEPPAFPYCPIGKWRGSPWNEVETSFLTWIMKTPTMEQDIKFNAKRELDRRFPDHKERHEQNDTGGFKNP